ncbi:MAG: rRNA methyltransferase [Gammaproteobacteria bacterium]|nr:MAG: rRNA methyltransferase [Gammaproteobacteria bacterium]RTZ74941.1 MAG: rRNA methyltransferase [Gammaproteobacteria bacterium]RTZ78034.1 MAG: rRNA methyltransferase [Gammaproteobacteria bacterium]
MTPNWAVAAGTPELQGQARALARRADFPLLALDTEEVPFLLVLTPERLELRRTGVGAPGPLYADFVGGAMRRRLRTMGKRSPLGRALGFSRQPPEQVVDATAGLGQDGFVIAALGCRITLVERQLPFFLLVENALQRAALDPSLAPIVQRITLVHADARRWLTDLPQEELPDVIHLDPMYPARKKSALSGKAMQLAQQLAGKDEDTGELLQVALTSARRRVVVKRPTRAAPIAARQPDFAITGKKTRYDIYLAHEQQ